MLPGCELFADGDAFLHSARKFIPLDDHGDENKDDLIVDNEVIPCGAVGCSQTFSSLLGYENHYNSAHRHTCLTCHRALPSAFLLDVHIQENHDPLFAILVDKQSMYRCLVESCLQKFESPDSRRQHMIKVHHYPSNFRFHQLRRPTASSARCKTQQRQDRKMELDVALSSSPKGLCGQQEVSAVPLYENSSFGSSGQVCGSENAQTETEHRPEKVAADPQEEDVKMGESAAGRTGTSQRTFVYKVPQKISFGHGVGRGFQRPRGQKKKSKGKHWHQLAADSSAVTATDIETISMTDMVNALDG